MTSPVGREVPARRQIAGIVPLRRNDVIVMLAIALFFALWAMRGALNSDITFNDEARHAMNGAALHDLVRDRAFDHPVQYIKQYFARYPALSMPYHPPLFPAIEAVFFAIFGVSHLSARIAIACFVFGVSVLLFRLIALTYRSARLAAAVAVIFLSLPLSQQLAADVMLEMPAMFFMLGSLLFMRSLPDDWSNRDALGAGLCACAAVWTKQAVFVGFIPFIYILVSRRWQVLRNRPVWIFSGVFTFAVVCLTALWARAGLLSFMRTWGHVDLLQRQWGDIDLLSKVMRNIQFYAIVFANPLFAFPAILITGLLLYNARRLDWRRILNGPHLLFIAWIFAVAAVLLVVTAIDVRYLWFSYPAIAALAVIAADRVARFIFPRRSSSWMVLAAAPVILLLNARSPIPMVTGPSEAARFVVANGEGRVLVAGTNNASVIFSIRSLYGGSGIEVIRGDKLPAETFDAANIERFAHRFGVRTFVLEKTSSPRPWDDLTRTPTPNMRLERVIKQASSDPGWGGLILVYRFLNPSPQPESLLSIPIASTGARTGTRPFESASESYHLTACKRSS